MSEPGGADAGHVIDADSVPERRLDARVRNIDGILYVAGPEDAFELSPVATAIWHLIDGRRSVRVIGSDLAANYDVDEATATRDVAEFIGQLIERGAIEQPSR